MSEVPELACSSPLVHLDMRDMRRRMRAHMTCMISRSQLHALIARSAYMRTTNAGSTRRAMVKLTSSTFFGCFGRVQSLMLARNGITVLVWGGNASDCLAFCSVVARLTCSEEVTRLFSVGLGWDQGRRARLARITC
jgi:hypothetical protein